MGIITVDSLSMAIRNGIDESRDMAEEEAHMLAHHVLNFFGYSDRIIDNVLEPEDRDAFYMLEDAGILTTEREETTLYDGREWRIHYWLFRREKISKLLQEKEDAPVQAAEEASVYDDLPDDIWRRGGEDQRWTFSHTVTGPASASWSGSWTVRSGNPAAPSWRRVPGPARPSPPCAARCRTLWRAGPRSST